MADQRDIALLKQMIKSVSDHAAQLFSQLASAGITQMQAVNTLSARLEALATAAPQPPQRSPSGAQVSLHLLGLNDRLSCSVCPTVDASWSSTCWQVVP